MPATRLPLVVTSDSALLDDLLRLAAAGGTKVDVAPDPAAARPRYVIAPLVMIGADQLDACLRARLPRRSRVAVVARGEVSDRVWKAAHTHGADHVAELPVAEGWVIDRFAELLDQPVGRVLAVIGGRGGAGASTLAAAVAATAAGDRRRSLLIDADPLGGGLDLMFGWERRDGLRWSALADADGRVDPPALLGALPGDGDLVLLSFDRSAGLSLPAEAMASTIDAARRARDVTVIDLPRRLDDAAVLALECADQAVLIVPAEVRASAAAARVVAMVRMHRHDLSLVVRGPSPGNLRAGDVASALKLPLVGTLRPEQAVTHAAEHGLSPGADGKGPLALLCRRLLDDLLGDAAAVAA
ncbi:septum site-determining protein Ssd [Actinoplanes solisilvae]|uniref:septum site-determining protein Ssd n=1 Tax=Actinoplanes solisilvae TaxID=2486853 RepID=UPI000FDA9620|nr:septum site-determining protein Ssd [Actinoplanes solisilvae]